MEDELILGVPLCVDGSRHLWAVLDGHGGRRAVERIVEWLPEALRAVMQAEHADTPEVPLTAEAIEKAMLAVDARLLASAAEQDPMWGDGATALLVISGGSSALQLAQLGDSQAVLCSAFGAEALCSQHRVGNTEEDARVEAAGGRLEEGRVVGGDSAVAVTRSLGDACIKRSTPDCVIAVPEVTSQSLSAADEILVLGCDGLWDVMEPDDAWDVAKRAGRSRRGEWDLAAAARALVDEALKLKTGDNVSVVVMGLRKTREQRKQGDAGRANSTPPKPPTRTAPRLSWSRLRVDQVSVTLNNRGGVGQIEFFPFGVDVGPA